MSISTYAELKTALARWSHRSDLTDDLDEIITLAENKLNSTLRLIDMEVVSTSTMSTSSRYLGYPTDMLEMMDISIQLTGNYVPLLYMLPEQLRQITTTSSAQPEYYTVRGDIEFNCVPSAAETVELHYIQKLALSDAATTNDVLTNYPNIYLHACLIEIGNLIDSEKLISRHTQLLTEAIVLATKRSARKRGTRKARLQSDAIGFTRTRNNIYTGY